MDSRFGDEIAQSVLPKTRRDPLNGYCGFVFGFPGNRWQMLKERSIRWAQFLKF